MFSSVICDSDSMLIPGYMPVVTEQNVFPINAFLCDWQLRDNPPKMLIFLTFELEFKATETLVVLQKVDGNLAWAQSL